MGFLKSLFKIIFGKNKNCNTELSLPGIPPKNKSFVHEILRADGSKIWIVSHKGEIRIYQQKEKADEK